MTTPGGAVIAAISLTGTAGVNTYRRRVLTLSLRQPSGNL